jgi:hypothetical protein
MKYVGIGIHKRYSVREGAWVVSTRERPQKKALLLSDPFRPTPN